MAVQEMEGYDEVMSKLLELLPPEKRLTGLSRDQMLLAWPDDELRKLPEEYLATFPEQTREVIRKRLGR